MSRFAHVLPLAILLAATLPAQAQTYSASTSISNIRYTLTDLDLTDGVTPYLKLAYEGDSTPAFGAEYWDHDAGQQESASREIEFFDTQTLAFDTVTGGPKPKHLQIAASISGDSLDSMAIANTATVDGRGQGGTFSDIILNRVFVLSPNTQLDISIDVSIAASQSNPARTGWASSYAFVRVDNQYAHFQHDIEQPGWGRGEAGVHTFSATAQSSNREHWVNTEMWVRATAVVKEVSPIPEPQTYAMLALGLGLIGWRGARRPGATPA